MKIGSDLRVLVIRDYRLGVVFVTGRGGAGFALGGPAATQARRAYFVPFPCPALVRGPATLIPWTGPPIFHHQKSTWACSGHGWGGALAGGRGGEGGKIRPAPGR